MRHVDHDAVVDRFRHDLTIVDLTLCAIFRRAPYVKPLLRATTAALTPNLAPIAIRESPGCTG